MIQSLIRQNRINFQQYNKKNNLSFSAIVREKQTSEHLTISTEEWVKRDELFRTYGSSEGNPYSSADDVYVNKEDKNEKFLTDEEDIDFLKKLLALDVSPAGKGFDFDGSKYGTKDLIFEIEDEETNQSPTYTSPTLGKVEKYTRKTLDLKFNEESPVFKLYTYSDKGDIIHGYDVLSKEKDNSCYRIPVMELSDQSYALFSQVLTKLTNGKCSLPERKTPKLPKADN